MSVDGGELDGSAPIEFIGRSRDVIRALPDDAREEVGYQLYLVQVGETPPGSKSMTPVGRGCREICVAENDGWFRVFYVANLGDVVYVLHVFQKKSNQTSKSDLDIGKQRYKQAVEQSKQSKK